MKKSIYRLTDNLRWMDWLLDRQGKIQKKLAKKHLAAGDLVLFDLSSFYFEGHCCELAQIGYSRDRRMISGKAINEYLCDEEGADWITALNAVSIAKLERCGSIQLTLFDDLDLASITHPDERLIVCRNPDLAKRRTLIREVLLHATEKWLAEAVIDGLYVIRSSVDKTLSAITRSRVNVTGHKKGDFKTTSIPTLYQKKTLESLGATEKM